MSTAPETIASKNRLYDPKNKAKDVIKDGHMDTTEPGWGVKLASSIRADIEKFGIPGGLIHDFYIDDKGRFKAVYTGMNGITELERNIVRDDDEITDNQLREQINKMVNDISCLVLKKASEKGIIYSSRMFYGGMVGLGEDAIPTCTLLSCSTGKPALCEPLDGNINSQRPDCRKCNVPQVFKEQARRLLSG